MFEEIENLDSYSTSDFKSDPHNNFTQKSSGDNQNAYGNKPKGSWNGGGGGKFQRKEEVVEDPYIPIALFVDRDFPPEVKTQLYTMAVRLIGKGITVRLNGDDKEFCNKLTSISDKHVELFIPWKNFNEIDSKHYYNTLTSKHVAQTNFPGWDKIPDSVKALMARNVRLIFGDKNNSISLCLLTWSKDAASKTSEVTKETGRSSFIIKVASQHGFPVINSGKQNWENILEKTFNL